jgi:hypothetical protein
MSRVLDGWAWRVTWRQLGSHRWTGFPLQVLWQGVGPTNIDHIWVNDLSWVVLILNSNGTLEDPNTVPFGWMPNPIGEVSTVREQSNRVVGNSDTIEGLEEAMKYMRCRRKGL